MTHPWLGRRLQGAVARTEAEEPTGKAIERQPERLTTDSSAPRAMRQLGRPTTRATTGLAGAVAPRASQSWLPGRPFPARGEHYSYGSPVIISRRFRQIPASLLQIPSHMLESPVIGVPVRFAPPQGDHFCDSSRASDVVFYRRMRSWLCSLD